MWLEESINTGGGFLFVVHALVFQELTLRIWGFAGESWNALGFEESLVLGYGLFLFCLLSAWEQSTIGFPIVSFVFFYALTKAYVLPILISAGVTAFMEHDLISGSLCCWRAERDVALRRCFVTT